MFFSYSRILLFDLGSEDDVAVATGESITRWRSSARRQLALEA